MSQKVPDGLRLCCLLPRQNGTSNLYIRNFKILVGLCSWAGQFVSCLIGDSRRQIFSWPGSYMRSLFENFICEADAGNTDSIFEPHHDKTSKMTCAPSEDSDQHLHPPSLSRVFAVLAQWVAKNPSFLHADSEDSDQTGWMPRLTYVFAGRTGHFVGFVKRRLIFGFAYWYLFNANFIPDLDEMET